MKLSAQLWLGGGLVLILASKAVATEALPRTKPILSPSSALRAFTPRASRHSYSIAHRLTEPEREKLKKARVLMTAGSLSEAELAYRDALYSFLWHRHLEGETLLAAQEYKALLTKLNRPWDAEAVERLVDGSKSEESSQVIYDNDNHGLLTPLQFSDEPFQH